MVSTGVLETPSQYYLGAKYFLQLYVDVILRHSAHKSWNKGIRHMVCTKGLSA